MNDFGCGLAYPFISPIVAAFMPARVSRTSTLQMASIDRDTGVLKPTGFWDPLGLAKDIDEATFEKYRTAELKHGRVGKFLAPSSVTYETLVLIALTYP